MKSLVSRLKNLGQAALWRLKVGPSVATAGLLAVALSYAWIPGAATQGAVEARSRAPDPSGNMGPAAILTAPVERDPRDLAAKSALRVDSGSARWELGWGERAVLAPLSAPGPRGLSLSLIASGSALPKAQAELRLVSNLPSRLWRQTPTGVEIDAALFEREASIKMGSLSPSGALSFEPVEAHSCDSGGRVCVAALTISDTPPARPWRSAAFSFSGLLALWALFGLFFAYKRAGRRWARAALALAAPSLAKRLPLPLSKGAARGEPL